MKYNLVLNILCVTEFMTSISVHESHWCNNRKMKQMTSAILV